MIKIHKEIISDKSYVPSFTLKLQVVSTAEGVTPCIFVHEYIPKNPMTGSISYDFMNVAYFDELTEVKDYVTDKKHVCLIRKSCIDKKFSNMTELNEFLAIVTHDIQRLLNQINTQTVDQCEVLAITENSVASTLVDYDDTEDIIDTPNENKQEVESIVISFDGKLNK